MTTGYAVAADTWSPIIGIPEPSFGITTSHTMYADKSYTYDYGSGPEPYRIGPDGPYTHYIMPAHPNATDTNNPYGTVEKPRLTRPNKISGNPIYGDPLPPGSVVEIHSGPQGGIGPMKITGTSALPIFIRGVEGDEPTFTGTLGILGSYIILENLKLDMNQTDNPIISIKSIDGEAVTNVAIRGCEVYNGLDDPGQSYQPIRILNDHDTLNVIENIVIDNNNFHNIADGNTGDKDAVVVSIDTNVQNVWITKNTFDHIGGDGVQIAADAIMYPNPDLTNYVIPNHIYVGKNIFSNMYENAVDLKNCNDIIISQNTVSNMGQGFSDLYKDTNIALPFRLGGQHEGPTDEPRTNVWALFNLVYNCSTEDGAIYVGKDTYEEHPDEHYMIGNIAYNIYNSNGNGTAFGSYAIKKAYWINNVAYNVDRAFYMRGDIDDTVPTEKTTMVNNIVSKIRSTSTQPYCLQFSGTEKSLARADISNNIFYNEGNNTGYRIGVWSDSGSAVDWVTNIFTTYADFAASWDGDPNPDFTSNTVEENPDFVDAANANFHLTSDSPAINAGALHSAYATFQSRYGISIQVDYGNNRVPVGIAHDIGAHEYLLPLVPKEDNLLLPSPPQNSRIVQ